MLSNFLRFRVSVNATYDKSGMVEYCCTGLCVDLLSILSDRLSFDYEMYEVPDRSWGIQDEVSGLLLKTRVRMSWSL